MAWCKGWCIGTLGVIYQYPEKSAKSYKYQNSNPLKLFLMADIALLDSPKLISSKI